MTGTVIHNVQTGRYEITLDCEYLLNCDIQDLSKTVSFMHEEVNRQKELRKQEEQQELAKFVDTYASEENIQVNLDNPFYAQDYWHGPIIPGLINSDGAIVIDQKEAKRILDEEAERERLKKIDIKGIYRQIEPYKWKWEYWFEAYNGETGKIHDVACDENGVALDPQWREKALQFSVSE